MKYRFEFVPVEKLHDHEMIIEATLKACISLTLDRKGIDLPILADDQNYVILDGHHRFHALVELGCKRVPAYLVDYYSPEIVLSLWPTAKIKSITKDDVIRTGLSGKPYTPKTSRHTIRFELPKRFVPLEELME
ncbi:MAG: ParB N-terminal domain-containing protein [Euryarchaeota archaeon]|nr:ParB N-terminal domain-containing protein [Euryarchaeota archaeon]